MYQPSYSQDMENATNFCFKKSLEPKYRQFTSNDEIKNTSLREVKAIPQIEFQKCSEVR